MAFGFFKKKNYADSIFVNAKLVSDSEELENCSWVAVKNGKILAIGEDKYYEQLRGKETFIYNLNEQYLCPGYIAFEENLSADILEDKFLKSDLNWNEEKLLLEIEKYLEENPLQEFCFVWNIGMDIFSSIKKKEDTEDLEESFANHLDLITKEIPTVLMFEDGISLHLNKAASQMVSQRAEEIGARVISPELALDTIISMDYELSVSSLMKIFWNYAQKGFTGLNIRAENSYFDKLCRDMLINAISCNMLKQRIFGSYPIKRMFSASSILYSAQKAKTECTELDGKISYDSLFVNLSSDESSISYIKEEDLKVFAEEAADKGFSITVFAKDEKAAITALSVLGDISDSYKKQNFYLRTEEALSEEKKAQLYTGRVIEISKDSEKDFCKNLEEGLAADFAIFREDPMSVKNQNAVMTVLDGIPVYRQGEDKLADWIDAMKEGIDSVAEDFTEEI